MSASSSTELTTAETVPGIEAKTSFLISLFSGGARFTLAHSGPGECGIPDNNTIVMTAGGNHSYVTR